MVGGMEIIGRGGELGLRVQFLRRGEGGGLVACFRLRWPHACGRMDCVFEPLVDGWVEMDEMDRSYVLVPMHSRPAKVPSHCF